MVWSLWGFCSYIAPSFAALAAWAALAVWAAFAAIILSSIAHLRILIVPAIKIIQYQF